MADVRVLSGSPCDVILEEAESQQADLIMMGSNCHGSNSPPILGSVVSKVLQLSKIPVYMVPMAQPRVEFEQNKHLAS